MSEQSSSRIIEVWADIVCPFTHVGLRRIVERRDAVSHPARLWVRAWPLELVNGEPFQGDVVAGKVAVLRDGVAPDLFVGFDATTFPATSLPALALTAAAYDRGPDVGESVALALRNLLFEEGVDIADADVLDDLASRHGLDADAIGEHAELADYEVGRARGVRGSPHFFVDGDESFCPSLDISHGDDGLLVRFDPEGFEAFIARALA
ncbi:MAG: DsbA family protein [Acidimicrobiia bacterium]|nr:DsbA family protein [Acidimicrobiia bacterium]